MTNAMELARRHREGLLDAGVDEQTAGRIAESAHSTCDSLSGSSISISVALGRSRTFDQNWLDDTVEDLESRIRSQLTGEFESLKTDGVGERSAKRMIQQSGRGLWRAAWNVALDDEPLEALRLFKDRLAPAKDGRKSDPTSKAEREQDDKPEDDAATAATDALREERNRAERNKPADIESVVLNAIRRLDVKATNIGTGRYVVRAGSTVVIIAWTDGTPSFVIIHATLATGVRVDPSLYEVVNTLNRDVAFIKTSVSGDSVSMNITLPAAATGEDEIVWSVAHLGVSADKYDDIIIEKFGGRRTLDDTADDLVDI